MGWRQTQLRRKKAIPNPGPRPRSVIRSVHSFLARKEAKRHFSFTGAAAAANIQGSPKLPFLGLDKLNPAVAYLFCLNLPAAFSQPGISNLAEPCNIGAMFHHHRYRKPMRGRVPCPDTHAAANKKEPLGWVVCANLLWKASRNLASCYLFLFLLGR